MKGATIAVLLAIFAGRAVAAAATATTTAFVPYKVEKSQEPRTLQLFGRIEAKAWSLTKMAYSALIKRIAVHKGQVVKKGELIAEVEVKYVASQLDYLTRMHVVNSTSLARALRHETATRREYSRTRQLVEKGLLAAADLERFESSVIEAEAMVSGARKLVAEVDKQIAAQSDKLRSASYFAEQDGIVTELIVDPANLNGAYLADYGATLARLDQPGRYVVRCQALDAQIAGVKIGSPARIFVEASGAEFVGKVAAIAPVRGDEAAGRALFQVVATFDDAGPMIPKDLAARVEITTGKAVSGLFVPWNAVKLASRKPSVLVQDNRAGWVERKVRLGHRGRDRVQILSGLDPGDVVQSVLW